jgi:hypothetical protein
MNIDLTPEEYNRLVRDRADRVFRRGAREVTVDILQTAQLYAKWLRPGQGMGIETFATFCEEHRFADDPRSVPCAGWGAESMESVFALVEATINFANRCAIQEED